MLESAQYLYARNRKIVEGASMVSLMFSPGDGECLRIAFRQAIEIDVLLAIVLNEGVIG